MLLFHRPHNLLYHCCSAICVCPLCRLPTLITKKGQNGSKKPWSVYSIFAFYCCQICHQINFNKGALFSAPWWCPCSTGIGQQAVAELWLFDKLATMVSVYFRFYLLFFFTSIGCFSFPVKNFGTNKTAVNCTHNCEDCL